VLLVDGNYELLFSDNSINAVTYRAGVNSDAVNITYLFILRLLLLIIIISIAV